MNNYIKINIKLNKKRIKQEKCKKEGEREKN